MKHLLSTVLFMALFCFFPFGAGAQSFVVDELEYEVLPGGDGKVSVKAASDSISGDVVIPAHVTFEGADYVVDSISSGGFIMCNSLESLTIPETVTRIAQVFCYGGAIESFVVSENNPCYCSVDGVLFSKDKSKLLCFPSSKSSVYTVPESVATISVGAFILFNKFFLVITDNVNYIEENGIVKYGSGVLEIACMPEEPPVCDITRTLSVAKLYVSKDSEEKYRNDSFWGKFSSVFDDLDSANLNLFSDGDFVYELAESGSQVSVSFDDTNKSSSLVIPSQVEYKGNVYDVAYIKDFSNSQAVSVEIPETAVEVCDYAFGGTPLTSVVFPANSSLKRIGSNAFSNTDILTLELPASVESLGKDAFACAMSLESVKLPDNLKYMSQSVFFETPLLESVDISPSNGFFTVEDNVLYSKDKSVLYLYPSSDTKESYSIAEGTDSVAEMAFSLVKNLKHLYIPSSVRSNLNYVFCWNISLTDITVDEGNEWYRSVDGVLYDKDVKTLYCYPSSRGKDFVIPQGVETVAGYSIMNGNVLMGGEMFLENIVFPESISYIGESALFCYDLNVYSESMTPPACDSYAFVLPSSCTLYVPDGCVDAYRNAEGWSRFSNIFEGRYVSVSDAVADDFDVLVDGTTIRLTGVGTMSDVQVYDVAGKMVHRGTDSEINLSDRGCYIVKSGENVRKIFVY